MSRVPLLTLAVSVCLATSLDWPAAALVVWLTLPFVALGWLDVRDRWQSARR